MVRIDYTIISPWVLGPVVGWTPLDISILWSWAKNALPEIAAFSGRGPKKKGKYETCQEVRGMIRDETTRVQNVVLGRLGRAQTHSEEYACFPHTGKIDFSESEPTEPAFIENTFSITFSWIPVRDTFSIL